MSAEMITTIVGYSTVLVSFVSWIVYTDYRMKRSWSRPRHGRGTDLEPIGSKDELGARIDGLKDEISAMRTDLSARIDKVADELVEVKIAVARVEGPPRHLITGR